MFDFLLTVAAGAVAIAASFLPRRYWGHLPSLSIEKLAPVNAALCIIASAVVGLGGFLEYSERVGRESAALILKAAELQLTGQAPLESKVNVGPLAMAMMSPLAFALFTPVGLVATYLLVTGVVRGVAAVALDPFGDPILTGIDTIVHRATGRMSTSRQNRRREREEGVEVPDRLYPGDWAGLSDVDFVVVASRRKPDWDAGTFVVTSDQWFVVGEPFEKRLPEGLRTIYPLTEHRTLDVIRRSVPYELPPLRKTRRTSSDTRT